LRFACFHRGVSRDTALRPPGADDSPRLHFPSAPPTARQVYALAAALCERMGEEFPETRLAASETIERLRIENGHPAPRLEDVPREPRRRRRSRRREVSER
jgi:hypothetical protein